MTDMTTKETVEKLLAGNARYRARETFGGDVSFARREALRDGQRPFAAVICCSDARVIPEVIFDAGLGDLFVIRTAGNTAGENERGSVGYAVEHLGVRTVVVLGHTRCGAVSAALHGEFDGPAGVITRRIKAAIGEETDPSKASVLNVRATVRQLNADLGNGAKAVGALYDLCTGKVLFWEN
ncbi:MAG: carbonic anhydrase [Clostridia bacterium]|nr:carbonic anhydrase [Clostridia bacterium]